MNKADLIDKIAVGAGISKTKAGAAVNAAVDSITAALKKGDRVALVGFGTFSVSVRKARVSRAPQTGATINIAGRKVAKFSPGTELKSSINKAGSSRKAREEQDADAFISTLLELSNYY